MARPGWLAPIPLWPPGQTPKIENLPITPSTPAPKAQPLGGGMSFPPEVERWRPLVAKYFPPELIDKALWVIMYESSGNPGAVGDGGAARGLFQIQDSRNFSSRPDAAWLDDPENNIRYAAQQLGAANNKWTDWGEGSTYNGQIFGALGNHPFPGGSADLSNQGGGTYMPGGDFYTRYSTAIRKREELLSRWTPLASKFEAGVAAGATLDPDLGLIIAATDPLTGAIVGEPRILMSFEEYTTYFTLDQELGNVEDEIAALEMEYEEGGEDIDDFITRADFNYATDPRNIDAQNAADQFAREMDIRTSATSLANQRLQEQNTVQEQNTDDLNRFATTNSFGTVFRAPRTHLPTADDLFNQAVETVSKGLPEVPDRPYYEGGGLPDTSRPPIGQIRGSILGEQVATAPEPKSTVAPRLTGARPSTYEPTPQRRDVIRRAGRNPVKLEPAKRSLTRSSPFDRARDLVSAARRSF